MQQYNQSAGQPDDRQRNYQPQPQRNQHTHQPIRNPAAHQTARKLQLTQTGGVNQQNHHIIVTIRNQLDSTPLGSQSIPVSSESAP